MTKKSKLRVWPFILFLLIELSFLIYVWIIQDSGVRQFQVMATIFSLTIFAGVTGLWFLFFSRLLLRRKFQGVGVAALLVILFLSLFRFEGMSGDLVPLFRFRLSESPVVKASDQLTGFRISDYPQFQGPDRTAVLPGINLDPDWETSPPQLLWRRPVGEGISGFSVAGSLAVTQEQGSEGEKVVAYDVSRGEPVWEHRIEAQYASPLAGVGPRSNPTISEGRVFAMGSTGWLTALELDTGKLLWEKNILEENERPVPMWGKSCSPLVIGDLVIVSIQSMALIAYSAQNGKEVWRQESDGANYSSPTQMQLAGRHQILSFNSRGPAGYAASTGELLWEIDWPVGTERISLPVRVDENRVLVSSGYGIGTKLLAIDSNGGALQPREVWHSNFLKSKFANFFVIGDYIYGLDDGIFVCLELATGKRVWKRGRYGHGQMILSGNLLLILAEDGKMVAIRPNPEGLEELSSFQALDGHTWNPPALAGELLLVRNSREAAAYWLK